MQNEPLTDARTPGGGLRRCAADTGLAAVAAGIGVVLRVMLDPVLDGREPYLLTVAVVAVVALRRGALAAVLNAVFGVALATWAFVVPPGSTTLPASGTVGVFTAALACTVVIFAVLRLRWRADDLAGQNRALVQRAGEHDHFLALASHELRSPLGAVRWALTLLRSTSRDEASIDRAVGILERQTRQLIRLVDDLVVLCGSQRGRLTIEPHEADLRSCVQAAVDSNRMNLVAKQQQLELRLPRDAVAVQVDEGRLAQAIANLLHNASKFSPAGAVIRVALEPADAWVHLTVRDGGPGFGKDPAHQGLGIGLQLSRTLVELHGGSLEVVEADGPGAVVRLSLPCVLPVAMAAQAACA